MDAMVRTVAARASMVASSLLGVGVAARTEAAQPPIAVAPATATRIAASLAALEYDVSQSGDGVLRAVNPAHDLRATFTAGGIELRPRSPNTPAFAWGMRLTRFGRAGAWVEVPNVAPQRTAPGRVEYPRGDVIEWFVNDARGIEHGFTVATRPLGEGMLQFESAVTSDLTASAQSGRIEFSRTSESVAITYDHLVVLDADRRELPATLELMNGNVTITIDDTAARYPLSIDPIAANPSWTKEGDQFEVVFGYAIDGAGDVNGDGFDDVIVGAWKFDNGENNEGRAFVFHGSATGLDATPAWTGESNQDSAFYGYSVAGAGDVNDDGYADVLVGALSFDNGESNEGRAYLYLGSAGGLAATPAWTAESDQAFAQLGLWVASAGDVDGDGDSDAIVGASLYDDGQTDEGAAFAYLGGPSGLAASPAWSVKSDQAGAQAGVCVAGAGDVNGDGFDDVLVGAYLYSNGQTAEGRTTVHHGSASGLSVAAATTIEGNQLAALAGFSNAGAGDVNNDGFDDILVGLQGFDNGQSNEGRAVCHHGSATGVATVASWTAESDQPNALFGSAVRGAGDVDGDGYSDVLIGAPNYDNGQVDEGRAFAYRGSPSGLSATSYWSAEGDQAGALFAVSVASAGDVDGDHLDDVLVGAWLHDGDLVDEGKVSLFRGTCDAIATATSYGTGKAGTLGIPALTSTPPVLGQVATLTISGGPAGASPVFLFAGFAPAAIPFDTGTLLVNPALTLTLPPLLPGGFLPLPVALPNDSTLCGISFYLQGGFVDPGAIGPHHTAQTPGMHWVFGS